LMLKEREKSDTVSLGNFYTRRAIRILPAYFVFLLVVLVLTFITQFHLAPSQWIRVLTFTSNYGWDGPGGGIPWPVAHLWSLSIEEQFYLLWPLAFLLAVGKKFHPTKLILICMIPILISPVARVVSYLELSDSIALSNFSFLLRGDSIAWGCILAIVFVSRGKWLDEFVRKHRVLIAMFAVLCIAVPLVLTRLLIVGIITVPLTQTLNAIGVSLLILLSIKYPRAGPFRALNWKPVMLVGVWSYSIYLWQQVFCTNPTYFGLEHAPWFLSFPLWFVPAILAGIASYYLVERPFLSLRSKFRT
ncbi:MAG: acyltransferase, partial [Pseudomonadota bacterium]